MVIAQVGKRGQGNSGEDGISGGCGDYTIRHGAPSKRQPEPVSRHAVASRSANVVAARHRPY